MNALDYAWKVTAAWLGVIVGISANTEDIFALSRRGRGTWQRYGTPFVLVLRGALEAYYQIEHVLESGSESLSSYQESLIMECNMISVAAAIVASVTITTYQFPLIMDMHWTVSAAFTFSLVASLFCVYGACTLQRRISNLPNDTQFRAWLTAIPHPSPPGSMSDDFVLHEVMHHPRANVATVLTLTAPKTLLDHSIRFFLAGLVGYLVCIHGISVRSNGITVGDEPIILPPSGSSPLGSRNTIIVCSFSLCIGISLLISPSSYKNFVTTLSSPVKAHAHGNGGIAEGPNWHGHSHDARPKSVNPQNANISEKSYLSASSAAEIKARSIADVLRSNDGVASTGERQEISLLLFNAIKESAAAHERSAAAARDCARVDEKIAELYGRLVANSGS